LGKEALPPAQDSLESISSFEYTSNPLRFLGCHHALFSSASLTLPLYGRAPGLDRLGHDRLIVFDKLTSLVHCLVHDLDGHIGPFMDMRFGSPLIPSSVIA
jgi:hypothetical protein